jgi:tagatose-1,6-bisphosphate aldolase
MTITNNTELVAKARHLASLGDEYGRFSMLAIDQTGYTTINVNERLTWLMAEWGMKKALLAGVEPEEFTEGVRLSNNAGASGFLCGRAVWEVVVRHFPNIETMIICIQTTVSATFDLIKDANINALPWQQHKRYIQN